MKIPPSFLSCLLSLPFPPSPACCCHCPRGKESSRTTPARLYRGWTQHGSFSPHLLLVCQQTPRRIRQGGCLPISTAATVLGWAWAEGSGDSSSSWERGRESVVSKQGEEKKVGILIFFRDLKTPDAASAAWSEKGVQVYHCNHSGSTPNVQMHILLDKHAP